MGKTKAVFNWSGGKDSALALLRILEQDQYELVSLMTLVDHDQQRSSVHCIPVELLQKQADSIGIPLHIVELTSGKQLADYEEAIKKPLAFFAEQGVTHFIFGDMDVFDVKTYREKQLGKYGITVVEPLWELSPEQAMGEFLDSGLQSVIVTTMADVLGRDYIGRHIDGSLIRDLPPGINICGENGEYHSFCYAGGMFRTPIPFSLGTPYVRSETINLDDGSSKMFEYWQADVQG